MSSSSCCLSALAFLDLSARRRPVNFVQNDLMPLMCVNFSASKSGRRAWVSRHCSAESSVSANINLVQGPQAAAHYDIT
jgi:hypothetical protein